jgi:hypothetical protein
LFCAYGSSPSGISLLILSAKLVTGDGKASLPRSRRNANLLPGVSSQVLMLIGVSALLSPSIIASSDDLFSLQTFPENVDISFVDIL